MVLARIIDTVTEASATRPLGIVAVDIGVGAKVDGGCGWTVHMEDIGSSYYQPLGQYQQQQQAGQQQLAQQAQQQSQAQQGQQHAASCSYDLPPLYPPGYPPAANQSPGLHEYLDHPDAFHGWSHHHAHHDSHVQYQHDYSGDEANPVVVAGESSPPITVSGSEISNPGASTTVTSRNNNNLRRPYDWLKKSSYGPASPEKRSSSARNGMGVLAQGSNRRCCAISARFSAQDPPLRSFRKCS
ncbi:uncharacterized protein LOC143218525 [Lasioglossum baleicum]|uniref:uncharacterized protein LOC143218525 n=1 Tax=Lasioglossum baleicum TaxID=434251 RepID=UPI003FCE7765